MKRLTTKLKMLILIVPLVMAMGSCGNKYKGFAYVKGGSFLMGSPPSEADRLDNEAQHRVTVHSFYMGQYEVTQAEYETVLGHNPSEFKGGNLPVENVSWYEAVEYCNKLSLKEGLKPAYSGSGNDIVCNFKASGYRLPTEAEWEYAAKGGNKDTMTYEYSGSNNADAVAWYYSNSGERTHDVGTKAPNSLGLYDMSGNVWEWCWDWYGDYSMVEQTDPAGAASGSYRVLHGGGWDDLTLYLRSAYRGNLTPTFRGNDLGFRVVRP
ncbi:hypothetical protein AGMMS50212_11910 [Spirochaetia bacterium]|nr:hypothetical protein AGMMS50212_11910 [Spirochaetia bacterium]